MIKEEDTVLLQHGSGKSFLRKVEMRTLQTEFGAFELWKLAGKKEGSSVKTSKGEKLLVLRPDLLDLQAKKLKRLPQIVHRKDVGLIITNCSIGSKTRVLEAGTGSAYLTSYLSSVAKEVVTYESRRRHYNVAKRNIEALGLDNVKIVNKDVRKAAEKDFDVVVLDLPKPQEVIPAVAKSLKRGGRIAVYSPCIEQSDAAVKALNKLKFVGVRMVELLLRAWESDKCLRPKTQMLGHTGFLVFGRKV